MCRAAKAAATASGPAQLALAYNSDSYNGRVGMGWSLSGLAKISRCDSSYVANGVVDKVNLDNDDFLCLNGQSLVVVSGSYGVQDSEYRTKDDSFVKVQLLGGNYDSVSSYFIVTDKSGGISTFGHTADSVNTLANNTTPMSWLINKYIDNAAIENNILFEYQQANGQQFIKDIYYTGQADSRGSRHVEFIYEDRNDRAFLYLAEGKIENTQRLKQINTYVESSQVFEYNLGYTYSVDSGKSLLSDIEQCAFDDTTKVCLPKKVFEYSDNQQTFSLIESTNAVFNAAYPWNIENQFLADFDNDGILDFVRYDTVHLMTFENDQYTFKKIAQLPFTSFGVAEDMAEVVKLGYFDFNSDGVMDFIGVNDAGHLSIATPNSDWSGFTQLDLGIDMLCHAERVYGETYIGNVTFGLNLKPRGTCRADTVPTQAGGQYLFYRKAEDALYLAKLHPDCTNGVCALPQTPIISTSDMLTTWTSDMSHEQPADFTIKDVDGDGDPDVLWFDHVSDNPDADTQLIWFENVQNGSGPTATHQFVKHVRVFTGIQKRFAMSTGGIHWIDANGDGLEDILFYNDNWFLSINQGNGVFATPYDTGIAAFERSNIEVINANLRGPEHTTHQSIRVVDFNGDGLQDFMFLDRHLNFDTQDPDQRDCLSDRERAHCKEGSGFESPSIHDFSISPLAFGRYSVYLAQFDSAGDIDFTLQQTEIVGSMNYFFPIDADSDGNLDFIGAIRQYDNTTVFRDETDPYPSPPTQVFFQMGSRNAANIAPDLLVNVEDEDIANSFGAQDKFVYQSYNVHQRLKNGGNAVVTDNSDLLDKDYYRIPATKTVVVEHQIKNNIGSFNQINFSYGSPIYHQKGLGFLGYESITTNNIAQGISTYNEYLFDYPLNGKVARTKVYEIADSSLLSQMDNYWCDAVNGGCDSKEVGVWFTRLTSKVSHNYNTDGTWLKTTTQTYSSYDDYGNITSQTTEVKDDEITHLTSVNKHYHSADEDKWWLDKLDYSQVDKSVTYNTDHGVLDGTNDTKWLRTTLVYNTGDERQLASKTQTASDTQIKKVTTYDSYDNYGNNTKVTNSGVADPNQPYSNVQHNAVTEYSYTASEGYFVNAEKNGLWSANAVTQTWDKRFGTPIAAIDINGLVTENQYDALGRVIKTTTSGVPDIDVVINWSDLGVYTATKVQDGSPTVVETFDRH